MLIHSNLSQIWGGNQIKITLTVNFYLSLTPDEKISKNLPWNSIQANRFLVKSGGFKKWA